MAISLIEANKYSTTTLKGQVIDRLAKSSQILAKLPFMDVLGNSFTYNTITKDSSAEFYAPNEEWTEESTPEVTQATAQLVILGGNADIDGFLKATRSNQIDLKATVIDNKIKAVRNAFLDRFYYGDNSTNTKEFTGLHKLLTSTVYNTVHAGTDTGTALSMAKLRAALDMLLESADIIVSSGLLRRSVAAYRESIGDKIPNVSIGFGASALDFDGIPWIKDEFIVNTETASSGAFAAKTGGANTSLFGLKFGDQGVCGLQSPEGVQTIELGELESKDADRTRIKWYCGLKLENIRLAVKVDGIVAAGTVTA
ncbi:major capsid protein [Dehalococcoides sp. THU4]|uniref:major capsid protein n=1 Tax=Dehalococcoides sp. THU4 TaxID=3348344 RepID=UPI00371AC0B7